MVKPHHAANVRRHLVAHDDDFLGSVEIKTRHHLPPAPSRGLTKNNERLVLIVEREAKSEIEVSSNTSRLHRQQQILSPERRLEQLHTPNDFSTSWAPAEVLTKTPKRATRTARIKPIAFTYRRVYRDYFIACAPCTARLVAVRLDAAYGLHLTWRRFIGQALSEKREFRPRSRWSSLQSDAAK